jgi:protein TonB
MTAPSPGPPAAGGAAPPAHVPRAAAARAAPVPSPHVPTPAPSVVLPAAAAVEPLPPAAPAPPRESDAGAPAPVTALVASGETGGVARSGSAGAVGGAPASAGGPPAAGAGAGRGGEGMLALAVPGDGGGAYGAYLALLRRRVQESLTYPAAARRRGLSGTVHLEITLEATGAIGPVALVRSSSHALLDDAALEAVRGLGRVPFPPEVRPRALRVRLPIVFELR